MSEVFISYKQEERERMRPIAEGLRELGVDVWFDERLQPDRSFTEEITHLIQNCRAQLVCWSPAAIASEWVRGEAEKGRQRGVLIAAMIEPCDLPPPFNMHHAESLVGWSGDPRHFGWRKICDAIGRKLDRPGLGELAALQGSNDANAWKKWAQKFPNDPQADAAWVKAEELEVGAARERMARDRESAKRAAEEAERRVAEPTPQKIPLLNDTVRVSRSSNGLRNRIFVPVLALAVIGALGFVAAGFWPRPPTETKQQPPVASDASASPQSTTAQAVQAEEANEPAPSQADATSASSALDRVSAREWSHEDTHTIMRRVLSNTSLASLRAAADAGDVRAMTILGTAFYNRMFGLAQSEQSAVAWWSRAAARGFAPAQDRLGSYYGFNAEPVNLDEALRLHRLAANQGHARAQDNVGVHYANGWGVTQDHAEAFRMWSMAAEQGFPHAYCRLGRAYNEGSGVARDLDTAIRMWRTGAQLGDSTCAAMLRNYE